MFICFYIFVKLYKKNRKYFSLIKLFIKMEEVGKY